MPILNLIAAGLLGVLGWSVFVLFSPYRDCRQCMSAPRNSRRSCWRCHGTRETRRLGAGLVHKIRLAVAQAWAERGFWR